MEGEREGQIQGDDRTEAQAEAHREATTGTQPTANQASDATGEQKIKMDESSSEKPSSQKLSMENIGKDNEETPPAEEGAGSGSRKVPDGQGSSRPQSSSSSARAKSSASGEIIFEAKKKKKRGELAAPDDAYTVTFTVSIAMAIPTGERVCMQCNLCVYSMECCVLCKRISVLPRSVVLCVVGVLHV